jgi:ribonuclease J
MNMMAFDYDGHLVIVDCGVMFPDAELLGVDIVIPDITFLRENQDRLKAILLTHGHEDHIGALPYVLDEVDAPVYGSPFTLALARAKLADHGMADVADLREMQPGQPFEVSTSAICTGWRSMAGKACWRSSPTRRTSTAPA